MERDFIDPLVALAGGPCRWPLPVRGFCWARLEMATAPTMAALLNPSVVPDANTKTLSRRNLNAKPLHVGDVRKDNQYSELSDLINTVIHAYDGRGLPPGWRRVIVEGSPTKYAKIIPTTEIINGVTRIKFIDGPHMLSPPGSYEIATMYSTGMPGLREEQLDAMFREYTPELRAERKELYKAMRASLCTKIQNALDHIAETVPKFASYSAALSCNLERDIELLRTIKHIVGNMDKNAANLVGGYRKSRGRSRSRSRSRSQKRRQTKKVKGGRRHPNQRR